MVKGPDWEYSSYCISKATLDAVTKSLAIELAPEVRVNSVAPGAIIWAASEEAEEELKLYLSSLETHWRTLRHRKSGVVSGGISLRNRANS